jgi:hypothetical protein
MPRASQIGAKYGLPALSEHSRLPEVFDRWYGREFGGEASFLGRALRAYVEGLKSHLSEAHRVLAPGGVLAYSLANTVRRKTVFDLATGFSQLLTEAGFVDTQVVPRVQGGRRILPAGRDTDSGQFTSDTRSAGVREYIVYAIKE